VSRLLAVALVLLTAATGSWADALDLPAIKEKGVIRIALYKDYPPYSAQNGGIDYDVAAAVAKKLQVKLDPMWFDADENVDDDLRNMVWKGHYLGIGPADAMIHAPIDPLLSSRNDRVLFVAPYFRDRLEVVHNVSKLPRLEDLSFLKEAYIGAEEASLASIVLLSTEGGKYRERVRHFKNPALAIEAMKKGEVIAVMAQHGEVEGLTRGDKNYAVSPPPIPGPMAKRQWVLGMAVKAGHTALGKAIEAAMTELSAEGELERIFVRHGVSYFKP
jgi:ABC-type amino acid transport substrate-binding protein